MSQAGRIIRSLVETIRRTGGEQSGEGGLGSYLRGYGEWGKRRRVGGGGGRGRVIRSKGI